MNSRNKSQRYVLLLALLVSLGMLKQAGASELAQKDAPQWQEVELEFTSTNEYDNPYLEVEAWVEFTHDTNQSLIRRPMFWDGGNTFRVRFASPVSSGNWNWKSDATTADSGLAGKSGSLKAMPHPNPLTIFQGHGFWQIPTGGRNLLHADGTARLLCADTAWALPWRATPDQVEDYAKDREEKGYNAALLMTVQPDMRTTGPRSRTEDLGFDVGFEDLPEGTLHELNAEYFRKFDKLIEILVAHGIAPVYQPVFHGYGWKGGGTAGNVVSAEDYARYCRYLVARYGARPAIWLIGGDGTYTTESALKQLDAAGNMIEKEDAYAQPTGIHYAPHALNRTHQDKRWLDFQWCQTGHNGEHKAERVADMWRNEPLKAVANGEPTYENMRRIGVASGWWQGHEAWCNLMAGGTMGVVYGAGSLWQWRLDADEPGHAAWCVAEGAGWREALEFEGSKYPGVVAKIFDGLPLAEMEPNWTCTYGQRGLLVPNKLFVLYLPTGGSTTIISNDVPRSYQIFDAKTGELIDKGKLADQSSASLNTNSTGEPRVIVFVRREN